MAITFGADPVRAEVDKLLRLIDAGETVALTAEGVLEPSNPTGRGRGFFYRHTGSS